MKYYRPAEEEKSDDSLFIRGSDDDDDDDDDSQTRSRHDEDETLLSSTPPTSTTIRERHYSFVEHQEELSLSPGGRYHYHLNSQQQQQQQQHSTTTTTTTRGHSKSDTSASASTGPPRIQIPTTTSLSSSSSSTDQDESSLHAQQNDHNRNQPQLQPHHDSDANYNNSNNNSSTGNSPHTVPADQERQILLLMLLAQVCALHDPTPRTFTVHVLELFERGILDRQSIHFLFDLGLVPSSSSSSPPHNNLLMASPSPPPAGDQQHQQQQEQTLSSTKLAIHKKTASASITSARSSTDDENNQQAMVTTMRRTQMTYQLQRSLEASAIRSTLEQQEEEEQQRQTRKVATAAATAAASASSPPSRTATTTCAGSHNSSPSPTTKEQQPRTSWSVEHHPLSLSRYIREFDEIVLLSSGSFGQVFHAKNKMDLRDYAIKRIPFAATGYSRESVQQVVREVQCLAVCDHPNVVRYYTSWLEPSWMTGYSSTSAASASAGSTTGSGISCTATGINDIGLGCGGGGKGIASKQKLLQDITHLVEGTGGCENLMDDLEAYFIDTGVPRQQQPHHHRHHRHFSVDASSDNSNSWISDQDFVDGEDYSDNWTIDHDDDSRRSSKDDSFLQDLYRPGRRRSDSRSNTKRRQNHDISSSSDAGQWKPSHQQQKHQHRQHKGRGQKAKQNESFRYQICLFIQMQLCHPRSLADWIRERNRSALIFTTTATSCAKGRLETAAVIFSQIAHGLGHVHSKGIIHRDMKPSNVFCSAEGNGLQFKIGDFGLSKLIRRVSDSSPKNHQQRYSRNNQHHDDHKHHHNFLLLENVSINGQAKGDSSSNGNEGEPSWQDPMTEGIGTASYAAPEQVSTRSYGKEADIFCLGLMLLELVCIFATEHERIQTFHDCRYRRKLPAAKHEQELFQEFPFLAQTILQCTDPNPAKRPTAQQLGNLNLMGTNRSRSFTNGSVDDGASGASDEPALAAAIVVGETEGTVEGQPPEESDFKHVSVLKTQLAEKDEQLKECQLVISEKDDMIADLRHQVQALQQQQQQQQQTANNASTLRLGLGDVEAESFSAEPAASCSSNSSSSDEGGL